MRREDVSDELLDELVEFYAERCMGETVKPGTAAVLEHLLGVRAERRQEELAELKKIAEVRQQIQAGTYATQDKLEAVAEAVTEFEGLGPHSLCTACGGMHPIDAFPGECEAKLWKHGGP